MPLASVRKIGARLTVAFGLVIALHGIDGAGALAAADAPRTMTLSPAQPQAAPGGSGDPATPVSLVQHPPLKLVSTTRVTARLYELVFTTPYLNAPTYVRVLLPPRYAQQPTRRFPTLLLLGGCCNPAPEARSWTSPGAGDAERITAAADSPFIVVTPDSGFGGAYTDWYNNGSGGNPRWESYILGQLVPWIDDHYRTFASRAGRAVAGLSMGGLGSLGFAGRHPDMFAAAASFSGAVDSNTPPFVAAEANESIASFDGAVPGSLYGLRATEELRWRAHNPYDLAGNLAGVSLILRTGNGQPGPLDTPGSYVAGSLEAGVYLQNVSMHERLVQLGIPHTWDDYGPGTHIWPYWNRSLAQSLAPLAKAANGTVKAPSTFTYTAIEPVFQAYGYVVHTARAVAEFATLRVNHTGFSVTGSGRATVITNPRYSPGAAYRASVTGPGGSKSSIARADRIGRLRLTVGMGPSNTLQQYRPGAEALRRTGTANVTLVPVAPSPDTRPAPTPAAGQALPTTGSGSALTIIAAALLGAAMLIWRQRNGRAAHSTLTPDGAM